MSLDKELTDRVQQLEELVHDLLVSVQYSPDEPFAAELARSRICGLKRNQIQATIDGLLTRAQGAVVVVPRLLDMPPAVASELTKTGPLNREQAVEILGMICGPPWPRDCSTRTATEVWASADTAPLT